MGWGIQVSRRSPTLNVGRLRNRISIVRVSPVQDSMGGTNLSVDILYANAWASVEALSGQDKFAAHEFVSEVSHQVVIRYIAAAPSWLANTQYLAGALVVDSNGDLEQAQTGGGLSGASAPDWSTLLGGFTEDGDPSTGITWKNIGPAPTRTGVLAKMQVWLNGRQFQIESVQNPDERNKMLILLCTEINDSQQQQLQGGNILG
jgi:head-tail adaptor